MCVSSCTIESRAWNMPNSHSATPLCPQSALPSPCVKALSVLCILHICEASRAVEITYWSSLMPVRNQGQELLDHEKLDSH